MENNEIVNSLAEGKDTTKETFHDGANESGSLANENGDNPMNCSIKKDEENKDDVDEKEKQDECQSEAGLKVKFKLNRNHHKKAKKIKTKLNEDQIKDTAKESSEDSGSSNPKKIKSNKSEDSNLKGLDEDEVDFNPKLGKLLIKGTNKGNYEIKTKKSSNKNNEVSLDELSSSEENVDKRALNEQTSESNDEHCEQNVKINVNIKHDVKKDQLNENENCGGEASTENISVKDKTDSIEHDQSNNEMSSSKYENKVPDKTNKRKSLSDAESEGIEEKTESLEKNKTKRRKMANNDSVEKIEVSNKTENLINETSVSSSDIFDNYGAASSPSTSKPTELQTETDEDEEESIENINAEITKVTPPKREHSSPGSSPDTKKVKTDVVKNLILSKVHKKLGKKNDRIKKIKRTETNVKDLNDKSNEKAYLSNNDKRAENLKKTVEAEDDCSLSRDEKYKTNNSDKDHEGKNQKQLSLAAFLDELNKESKLIKETDCLPLSEDDDSLDEDPKVVSATNKFETPLEENKAEKQVDNNREELPGVEEKITDSASSKSIMSLNEKIDIKKEISDDDNKSEEEYSINCTEDRIERSPLNIEPDVSSNIELKREPEDDLDQCKPTTSSTSHPEVSKFNNEEKVRKHQEEFRSKAQHASDDLNDMSSEDSSESSDSSDSSDDSSSNESGSSDSESSSESETGSDDSSDSDSSDSENEKKPKIEIKTEEVVRTKKLKIRNAPSTSLDGVPIKIERKDSTESGNFSDKFYKSEENTTESVGGGTSYENSFAGSFSQMILSGGKAPELKIKRGRGRPRKYPISQNNSVSQDNSMVVKQEPQDSLMVVKQELPDSNPEGSNEGNVVVSSFVNSSVPSEFPVKRKRGRQPGFRPKMKKRGRPRKYHHKHMKMERKREYIESFNPDGTPKRRPGRPRKSDSVATSTPNFVNLSQQYMPPSDQLSEQLMQLDSQLNLIVNSIPSIPTGDDQNSCEITDNQLLEEINTELDVITEEIVSEDVTNYLDNHQLNEILPFQESDIKKGFPFGSPSHQQLCEYRRPSFPKKLKTDDPSYHKRYYKYVKIPKDQQKKRGPKKKCPDGGELREKKIKLMDGQKKRGRGRPRKYDLGARPYDADSRSRSIETSRDKTYSMDGEDQDEGEYDESLSKELENVNRSMENILTGCDNDKDFVAPYHVRADPSYYDEVKRSNRPNKLAIQNFSEFDQEIDQLIEQTALEDVKPKSKYNYYQKIPKHLQKKRGRPRKDANPDDPNAPPRPPPKPKKEKVPKPKKTKIVIDPDTGEEREVTDTEAEQEYLDFDEEDEYDEDIDDEDKDKDFDIGDYLGKNNSRSNGFLCETLEYEEVYTTKEKPFKTQRFKHKEHQRFGAFGKKIHAMMPRRPLVNACNFRFVTVVDRDLQPYCKAQRMFCVKVAPASYHIAERYKPKVKLKRMSEDDVDDFFDKYWCDECEISLYYSKISKRRHNFIYHEEEIDCDLCDRIVSNRFNLRKHREIFHQQKKYKCRICDEEYLKFKAFQMHVWETHPYADRKNRAYFCNICQAVFYRRESFKFHYHEHLNGNIFAQFDTSLSDIEFLLKQLMY